MVTPKGIIRTSQKLDPTLIEFAPYYAFSFNENDAFPAMNVLDLESDSIWHSPWQQQDQFPQSLTLALGACPFVTALAYTPRQDGVNEGNITEFVLYASPDGCDFFEVARGTWQDNAETKFIYFERQQASSLRLVAEQGVNGYASACNVRVYSS
jgi:hypothetical protein